MTLKFKETIPISYCFVEYNCKMPKSTINVIWNVVCVLTYSIDILFKNLIDFPNALGKIWEIIDK